MKHGPGLGETQMAGIPWVLGALLLSTASTAQVSPPAAGSGDEIIVEGQRDRGKAIDAFVKALTPARAGGQLSRFDQSVCPASFGLDDGQNRQIVARMKAVAQAAGLTVAAEGCRPNALVITVRDKDEFVAVMRKERPAFFVDPLGMPLQIPKVAGPAVAWHVKGMVDSDGVRAAVADSATGGRYYEVSTSMMSRIRPNVRPDFLAGVLVIDVDALVGLTTTQIADYAAMRLYSQADPASLAGSSQQSILKVVDAPIGSDVPVTLTAWDLAFLKSLYATDPQQKASSQRNDISRRFKDELNGSKDESNR